jgi:predicted Zn-dependent protease
MAPQTAGCNAIRSICTNEVTNQTQAGPAGAHDAVCAAMKAWPADATVQLAGIKAFLGLVANHPDAQQRVSRYAAVVQRAQRQHQSNKEIQDKGRDLLGLIAKKKGGCAIL